MPVDTLIRITDVQRAANGTQVTYTIEDRPTQCIWQSRAPETGDVYLIDPEEPGHNALLIGRSTFSGTVADMDSLRWRAPVMPSALTRMEILRRRNTIRKAVRAYFDSQDFIEIEPPLLVHGTTPDIAIDSFNVGERYLVSSTEYQLKRMAVGGFSKVYSLTKNFRRGDASRLRNPEFTMLEWGRVGGIMSDIENDVEVFVCDALDALDLPSVLSIGDHRVNFARPWQRLSVLDAIAQVTGVAIRDFRVNECRAALDAAGIPIQPEWSGDSSFLFSLLMQHVESHMGLTEPVFLTEWPLFQTTSAGADPNDPTRASRSELIIAGVEIADGFAGLADIDLQKQLFKDALAVRSASRAPVVDLDQRYLSAMTEGCPFGAGMALGFDRLVMLLTGQTDIKSVLAFGWDEV